MRISFYGAAGEVTGSCHLLEFADRKVVLDCGLVQGSRTDERRNRSPFPFAIEEIDAVVLSHAHIDHSGRLPLLVREGYRGPIYTHRACRDLCRVMLRDAAYLSEREAEWENKRRERKGLGLIEPLYTMADASAAVRRMRGLDYERETEIVPGLKVRLHDAGHILGSSIVELEVRESQTVRTVVFTGDLGHRDAPILRNPHQIERADVVLLEGTYGDRLHRPRSATYDEIGETLESARRSGGNVLVPAFAVGRSQDIISLLARFYDEWRINEWSVFLDSPLAIEATEVYAKYAELYNHDAVPGDASALTSLRYCRTPKQSMSLNRLRGGAIIIAGSGMCSGGRIKHHLRHNAWRRECHILISGFQAAGTTGRAIVDGARYIRLWGETIRMAASVHTIGGLSAHADQRGLIEWFDAIRGIRRERPQAVLVHGEADALASLAQCLNTHCGVEPYIPSLSQSLDLVTMQGSQSLRKEST